MLEYCVNLWQMFIAGALAVRSYCVINLQSPAQELRCLKGMRCMGELLSQEGYRMVWNTRTGSWSERSRSVILMIHPLRCRGTQLVSVCLTLRCGSTGLYFQSYVLVASRVSLQRPSRAENSPLLYLLSLMSQIQCQTAFLNIHCSG